MPYDETKHGTPENQVKIEAVEPLHFPAGSFDDLIYRLGVVEVAENYIFECDSDSKEWADSRFDGFIKAMINSPAPQDEIKKAVIKHVAYLRAQTKTKNQLREIILGPNAIMSDNRTKEKA